LKQGFTAGCSLEVTMSLGKNTYEFIKPSYYAGVTEEWDTEVDGVMSDEALQERITQYHKSLRRFVEKEIDIDIYDIKNVKLFQQVLKEKGGK
jgi:hypothetical protein